MKTLIPPLISMFLAGCYIGLNEDSSFNHDDSNDDITVVNQTDQDALLAYTQCSNGNWVSTEVSALPSGAKALLYACGGSIEVRYDGKIRNYDLDPDFWGRDKITIRAEEFED